MNTVTKKIEVKIEHKSIQRDYWSQLFLDVISKINKGKIIIHTPEGETLTFGKSPGETVRLTINDWKVADNVFLSGDIGLGESYIAGHWESDNINGLIKLGIDNYDILKRVIAGARFKIAIYRFKNLILNRNTKSGSRRNIHAHYDLGNNFYQSWLDPSMTYSSALYDQEGLSLEQAQERKYQSMIGQLDYKEGQHILEVGCGWGGFMEYAAKQGIKVTGVTISKKQYDFAKVRLTQYGDLCTLKLQDYRDIDGMYDHIVSIEMFEALGQAYWTTYFKKITSILKPGGNAVIQSITMNNRDFESYSKGSDFIQQYIFPGGMLPSPEQVGIHSKKGGLKLVDEKAFGLDYAKTLLEWEANFTNVLDKVKEMKFGEEFIRRWRFYLKYCQGGFEAKKNGVSQFTFIKEG